MSEGEQTDDIIAPTDDNVPTEQPTEQLSKNQMRRKRKVDALEQRRQERKENRKVKKVAIREKRYAERVAEREAERAAASGSGLEGEQKTPRSEKRPEYDGRRKRTDEEFTEQCTKNPTVVIDCEFEELQTEKELGSLSQQLMSCYGLNRKAETPVRMSLVGLGPHVSKNLKKISGFDRWRCQTEERKLCEVFKAEDLIYLTADSPHTLGAIGADSVLVVGGLVDRNRHKCITMRKAEEAAVRTARLPISEHIKLSGSSILTVNNVFNILLDYVRTNDWKAAFNCIPQRKREAQPNPLTSQPRGAASETSESSANQVPSAPPGNPLLTTNPILSTTEH